MLERSVQYTNQRKSVPFVLIWMQFSTSGVAVLKGLEIAHQISVTIGEQTSFGVHEDACPENVMILSVTKEIMFIDFELSRLEETSNYPHNLTEKNSGLSKLEMGL